MEQRTFNTAIQGQALIAATNGLDIRALDFTSALKQLPAMTGVFTIETVADGTLYTNELVQSSIGHFLVNANNTNYISGIFLGPDTPEQASNYINLFNLKDTSDVRILDFVKTNDVQTLVVLSNLSIPLTANYVTVNNIGFDSLFGYSAKPGTHRLVSVQKVSDDKVNFTVLPGCCNDLDNPYPPPPSLTQRLTNHKNIFP